jgi:transcriptional regulator with XRE-family HTH domain
MDSTYNKRWEMQKDLMLRLAKRIRSERENKGFDIIEIVVRSGVSQATLYNLEAGIADNITLKSLVGLSVAFEIDLIMLLRE